MGSEMCIRDRAAGVTMVGPVQNPQVPWVAGLTLAQAVAGSVAGLAGVVPAAVAGWLAAGSLSRLRRGALTAALGVAVAAVVVPKLF